MSLYSKFDGISMPKLNQDATVSENPKARQGQRVTCAAKSHLTPFTAESRRRQHDELVTNNTLGV